MKIVHIITNFYAGGAQTFVVLLAIEQKAANQDVSVVIIDELSGSQFEKNLIAKLVANNISVRSTNRRIGKNLSVVKCVYNICDFIKAERPDVINSHLPFTHMVTAAALKVLRLFARKKSSHVITIHNAPEVWNRPTILLNKKTPSIYCSHAAFNTSIKRGSKNIVIENGIEQPSVNNSWQPILAGLNIDQDDKIVLCVGKLSTQKNYELVGRIAALNANNKVSFLVCGPPDDTYEKSIKTFNMHANIHYLGVVVPEEVHSLMARCDCFLNTSLFEGLPITILEAFFIGTPCLLSPIAPHYEIGEPVPYCYIADSFDPLAFNEKLTQILSLNLVRLDIMTARVKSLEKFGVSSTAQRYIDFYSEISGRYFRKNTDFQSSGDIKPYSFSNDLRTEKFELT